MVEDEAKTKIKVSVIVPIYNAEAYLDKCVKSIISQSLRDIEVILINDGSTDNSLFIAEKYAKLDSRVRVINKENSGPAASRNIGIREAKGEYIGFVDSDDYVSYDMYEKLYALSKENETEIAMCSYYDIYGANNYAKDKKIVESGLENGICYKKNSIRKHIITTFTDGNNYGFFSMCNKIYKLGWLRNTHILIDESREHGEDWWFNINLFVVADSFICTNEALYNYVHVNENSLISKYRENQFKLYLDGRLKVKSIIPEELINEIEFNKNFIYEFSSFIIRTYINVKEKKKRNLLLGEVVKNKEVRASCEYGRYMPIHYRITCFLIRNKMRGVALDIYRVMSIIIK